MLLGMVIYACQIPTHSESSTPPVEKIPNTLGELNAWYPAVLDTENAALEYAKAFNALQEPSADLEARLPAIATSKFPNPNEPLSEDMRVSIVEIVSENEFALECSERAAMKSACRFPLDFNQGINVELLYLRKFRWLARLHILKGIGGADSGDAGESFDALKAAFAMGKALHKEPLLISQLVKVGCNIMAVAGLERCISQTTFTDGQLAELQRVAQAQEDPDWYYRSMVSERCLTLTEIKKPFREASRINDRGDTWPEELYSEASRREIELALDKAIAAAHLPGLKRHDLLFPLTVKDGTYPALEKSTLNGSIGAYRVHDRDTANLRLSNCGLALERYYLANKSWPDSLSALVPKFLAAVPEDPFDNQPLRLKRDGDMILVYSLGEDRDDDQGRAFVSGEERASKRDGDLVFRCYQ